MTIEKSELKMLLARDFGQQMEKAQEKAEHGIYESKGAAVAFLKVETMLNQQAQATKNKLMEGKVEQDLTDPAALARFVVGELMTVTREIHKLGDGASKAGLQSEGEKKAWGDAAKMLFEVYKQENNKIMAFREAVAAGKVSQAGDDLVLDDDPGDNGRAGPPPPRPMGMHPGMPLKAVREKKMVVTKAKKKEAPEASGTTGKQLSLKTEKPAKKRKPRKQKVASGRGDNGAKDS